MFDDQAGWGTSEEIPTNDVIKDAMKKEQIIKCESFYDFLPYSNSCKAGIFSLIRTTSEVFAQPKPSLRGDSLYLTQFFFSSALRACKDRRERHG